jgi:recombinational DNA repair ATPase RecF
MNRAAKWTTVLLAVLAGGCLPAATDQEIEKMCENLVRLRGEADLTPVEERIAAIDKDIAARKAGLESRHAQTVEGLDRDLAARLAEIGEQAKPEDRAAIEQEIATRKADAETQRAEALSRLEPDREARVAEAREKLEQAKATAKTAIEDCAGKARTEGVTQKLAQCRAEAGSTDQYWNQCR